MSDPPPTGLRPPDAGESVSDYVAANRERFTLAALRRALLAAGHDPAAIDAGLYAIGSIPVAAAPAVAPEVLERRRVRSRIAVIVVGIGAVAIFLGVAFWYAQSMSMVGALVAGVLLAFGIGFGFLASMTALSEKSARLWRGNIITAVAAAVSAPLLVLLVLTGICVAVSRPIDWVTGGLP